MIARLIIAAGFLFLCGAARAKLPPQAQEAFDQGIAAENQGRYADALLAFQEARKASQAAGIYDTPEIYRQLGATEAKIPGRELRAICWLAAYLSATPGAADAAGLKMQIIALHHTSRGNLRRLVQTADDAGHKVAAVERARGIVETSLDTLVVLWDDFGDYAKAMEIAGTIGDPLERCGAYHRVSYAQIQAGDFAGARVSMANQQETTFLIDDPYWDFHWRGTAQIDLITDETHLAEEQAKRGDLPGARASILEARQIADHIAKSTQRSHANRTVAIAQAVTGDIAGARETVSHIWDEIGGDGYATGARIVIAEAQLKTGDLAGARKNLDAASLDAAVAELDRAGSKLGDVYQAISAAQTRAQDYEGAQRTLQWMDGGERLAAAEEVARMNGATATRPSVTTGAWLQMVEGGNLGWERSPGLRQPIFTTYDHAVEEMLARNADPEQTFSALGRAADTVQRMYDETGRMLREQFGL